MEVKKTDCALYQHTACYSSVRVYGGDSPSGRVAGTPLLPRKLGEKLKEKAAETGYLPDELGVELLRKSLNEELDPEDLVEQYRELSEKYLAEAKELLSVGDLVQASEKFWGASALVVKSVAAKRGLQLGNVLSFVTPLEHQQFLPCPNVIRDTFSYARCSHDVFLTFLRFDRQC